MDKIMEAVIEINTKGTLQEQAVKLADEMRTYKMAIRQYNEQIENVDNSDSLNLIYLMRKKYKIRLEGIKKMCSELNARIIDTMHVIEEHVPFEDFVELFGLNEDEIDSDESFYENLIVSSEKIGHVCRTGLIYCEKVIFDIVQEEVSMFDGIFGAISAGVKEYRLKIKEYGLKCEEEANLATEKLDLITRFKNGERDFTNKEMYMLSTFVK